MSKSRREQLTAWKTQKRHREDVVRAIKSNENDVSSASKYNLRRQATSLVVSKPKKQKHNIVQSHVQPLTQMSVNKSSTARILRGEERGHIHLPPKHVDRQSIPPRHVTLHNSQVVGAKLIMQRAILHWKQFVMVQRQEQRELELHRYVASLEDRINLITTKNETLQKTIKMNREDQHKHELLRRKLHQQIQDLKGRIRVFGRMRPMLNKESSCITSQISSCGLGNVIDIKGKTKRKNRFALDQIFGPQASQQEVFNEVRELVTSVIDGYDVNIFCYGVTGTGKTYTLTGPPDSTMSGEHCGILPRCIQHLFQQAQRLCAQQWSFHITVSYWEIYNESVRDLLEPNSSTKIEIRLDSSSGLPFVSGVSAQLVTNAEDTLRLLHNAEAHRACRSTSSNHRSSRSHAIFQMNIVAHNTYNDTHIKSVLSLVDLAGSEKLDMSSQIDKAEMKETKSINQSLSSLGVCIQSLARGSTHVSFRSSTLTFALQQSLVAGKTLFLVHWSPNADHISQSINTLRFACTLQDCHRSQAIKNSVTSNSTLA